MEYPTRCKIIDVTGEEVFPGIIGKTPVESKPHIGKEGLAEKMDDWDVRITLDDGNIIWGYECWWEPLPNKSLNADPKGHGDNSDVTR